MSFSSTLKKINFIFKITFLVILIVDKVDFYKNYSSLKVGNYEFMKDKYTYIKKIEFMNFQIRFNKTNFPHSMTRVERHFGLLKKKIDDKIIIYLVSDLLIITLCFIMLFSNSIIISLIALFENILRLYNLILIEFEKFENIKDNEITIKIIKVVFTRIYSFFFGKSLKNFLYSLYITSFEFKWIIMIVFTLGLLLFINIFNIILKLIAYIDKSDKKEKED